MCKWNARLILSAVEGSGPSLSCGRILSHALLSGCVRHRRAGRLGPPVILIAVVTPHPVGEVAVLRLIAPFGHDIEQALDGKEALAAAAIGRIGVINRAVVIPVEDADS